MFFFFFFFAFSFHSYFLQMHDFYLIIFYDFYLKNFSFCLYIFLLILLSSPSVFSWNSLSFIETAILFFFLFRFVCFFWCTETAILNFLPGILQIFMSLCVAIVILWLCYFTLILHISFALLSLHLKWKSLPWVFTVFGVRNNLLQPC